MREGGESEGKDKERIARKSEEQVRERLCTKDEGGVTKIHYGEEVHR